MVLILSVNLNLKYFSGPNLLVFSFFFFFFLLLIFNGNRTKDYFTSIQTKLQKL